MPPPCAPLLPKPISAKHPEFPLLPPGGPEYSVGVAAYSAPQALLHAFYTFSSNDGKATPSIKAAKNGNGK